MLISLNAFAQEVKRNPDVPLENIKIGDKFKIIKTTTKNETTFDFTGLGLDDSMANKVRLSVYYFTEKQAKEKNSYFYSININDSSRENLFSWTIDVLGIKTVYNDVFKQTIKTMPELKLFKTKIKRIVISLTYYPYGYAFFGTIEYPISKTSYAFNYQYEGFINGTGEVELVNCYISTPGAVLNLQNKKLTDFYMF